MALACSSCGYRFTPVGGMIPADARSIAIVSFVNETQEPYVDVESTRAVVEEFLTDGRLKVVGTESAALLLKGRVTKFEIIPQSYTAESYVQQYQVVLDMNMSLEDTRTHTMLWQEKELGSVFVSSYPVSIGNISATKMAKEAALKRVSQDVARTIRSRVLEGF